MKIHGCISSGISSAENINENKPIVVDHQLILIPIQLNQKTFIRVLKIKRLSKKVNIASDITDEVKNLHRILENKLSILPKHLPQKQLPI